MWYKRYKKYMCFGLVVIVLVVVISALSVNVKSKNPVAQVPIVAVDVEPSSSPVTSDQESTLSPTVNPTIDPVRLLDDTIHFIFLLLIFSF